MSMGINPQNLSLILTLVSVPGIVPLRADPSLDGSVRFILHDPICPDKVKSSYRKHNAGIIPCLFGITADFCKLSDGKLLVCHHSRIIQLTVLF